LGIWQISPQIVDVADDLATAAAVSGCRATGSQSQETPRTTTSVAAGCRTSTSPSQVSGAGAPSSSDATTPNNAQPTAATAAETAEAGGTSYVVVDDEDDEPVVKKRKLKSDVWLEFDQVKVAGRQKAQCHWCKKVLVGDVYASLVPCSYVR
jgi:hypothetical protein